MLWRHIAGRSEERRETVSGMSTGFHRIGVTLAVPLLCLAVWFGFVSWRDSQPLPVCKGMFDDLIPRDTPTNQDHPRCFQYAPGTNERGPWDMYRDKYTRADIYGADPNFSY